MPLDRIVLETDCPYLSPVPNRGKRNSSLNLPYVVEEISRIKDVPAEEKQFGNPARKVPEFKKK